MGVLDEVATIFEARSYPRLQAHWEGTRKLPLDEARSAYTELGFEQAIRRAVRFRLRGDQMRTFLNVAPPDSLFPEDLRSPYPTIAATFDPPFIWPKLEYVFDDGSTGALDRKILFLILVVSRLSDADEDSTGLRRSVGIDDSTVPPGATTAVSLGAIYSVDDVEPMPVGLRFGWNKASLYVGSDWVCSPFGESARAPVCRLMVNLLLWLTAQNVELVKKRPSAALQRARERRGERPLPSWYEIEYRSRPGSYAHGPPTGRHHAYRYDVRGHWRRLHPLENCPEELARRFTWVQDHQRGLSNKVYVPKGYRALYLRGGHP